MSLEVLGNSGFELPGRTSPRFFNKNKGASGTQQLESPYLILTISLPFKIIFYLSILDTILCTIQHSLFLNLLHIIMDHLHVYIKPFYPSQNLRLSIDELAILEV